MNWFTRLKALVFRWLSKDDPYAEMEAAGFRKCYYTSTDGGHGTLISAVGWWVEEDGRCWQFAASVYDPDAWPTGLEEAFFLVVSRPDDLVGQAVITSDGDCWWASDTLILSRCTPYILLARLVDHPVEWQAAAQRLGVVVHDRWAYRN
jgi:hypothetical protein